MVCLGVLARKRSIFANPIFYEANRTPLFRAWTRTKKIAGSSNDPEASEGSKMGHLMHQREVKTAPHPLMILRRSGSL
jgi:hypothetical protein